MNEVQAAMGLLQLKYIDENIANRKQIAESYQKKLNGIEGLTFLEDMPDVKHCYSYFPIFIDNEKYGKTRDELYEELKKNNIFGRRYFYPLISQFPTYRGLDSALPGKLPVAEKITEQVICLPIYSNLKIQIIEEITNVIKNFK